ncbi:MAG: PE-PPE domain-containing protein [Mycobacterium sp.]
MTSSGFRRLGVAPLAIAGAVALGLTATVTPPFLVAAQAVMTEVAPLNDETDTTALFVGPTGVPIPPQPYIDILNDLFVHCDPPACTPQGLATPEGLYPITGVKSLPLDASLAQGVTILNNAIGQQISDGHDVIVSGYSQSSVVASMEMANIVNGSAGIHPDPDQLSFVLLGDSSNPNGGMLERFDLPEGTNPSIASLGITFNGAQAVTEYPTDIYTGEYDGFADFPRYPINFLSDLNALLGLLFVHLAYPALTPDQIANAVEVPTSAGYAGDTTYYMIPTEHLPLLDPLRLIPVVGPLFADLIEPDMRVLVNLGYGDPEFGWVNADANVPTPAGLFPSLNDLEKVPGALLQGTEQGIQQFIGDLENPSQLLSPAENPILELIQNPAIQQLIGPVLFGGGFGFSLPTEPPSDSLLSIVNALSGAVSAGYSALLPTADIANALLTSLPAYDANIFSDQLADGNLLDAIGLPIAVDVGLVQIAATFELLGVGGAAAGAAIDLASPFVDVSSLLP